MKKRQFVNPMSPVQSAYGAMKQTIGSVPVTYPYARKLRALMNSDVFEYMRKDNDMDAPERAIIGSVVSQIDEIDKDMRAKLPYVRQLQKIIIEYVDVTKEREFTVVDISWLKHPGGRPIPDDDE